MTIKGSQTEKNLLTAFAGESQARNRYSFYAKQAAKDGLLQIANIFEETAEQERVHAKNIFKFLEGGDVEIRASFPAGVIGKTSDNLAAAAAGEHHEWSEMYPTFARVAREEGFEKVANLFSAITIAERGHERRYLALKANVDGNKVFNRENKVTWRCLKCGYLHEGTGAPDVCPACGHPKAYFEVYV